MKHISFLMGATFMLFIGAMIGATINKPSKTVHTTWEWVVSTGQWTVASSESVPQHTRFPLPPESINQVTETLLKASVFSNAHAMVWWTNTHTGEVTPTVTVVQVEPTRTLYRKRVIKTINEETDVTP